jgi:hypothetical protein
VTDPAVINLLSPLIGAMIIALVAVGAWLNSKTQAAKIAGLADKQGANDTKLADVKGIIADQVIMLDRQREKIETLNLALSNQNGLIGILNEKATSATRELAARDEIIKALSERVTRLELENVTLKTETLTLRTEKVDLQGLINALVTRLTGSDRPLSLDTAIAARGAPPAPPLGDVAYSPPSPVDPIASVPAVTADPPPVISSADPPPA